MSTSSTTYTARSVPMSGPSTSEFPAVREQRQPAWPPQHHRPFIVAGGVALAAAIPLLITYSFIASDPDTARQARTLLHGAGLVLMMLSGVAFIAAAAIRANDRAIAQATAHGVGEVHRLETLHGELQAVSTHLSAVVSQYRDQLGRIEVALPERLGERLEVLEAHKSSGGDGDQSGYDDRYLTGYADGLAGRTLGDGNVVPFSGNGSSPANKRADP